ncbi:hypothetical protein GCM10023187_52080 [Nibrella viscosa]|uniref:SIR2-like domain-containing protein n=1 Tax=Nibrella viscosa TaxID=1084524 RepID=A0ABP8KXA8_9BACT
MRSALRSTNGSIILLLGAGASLEAGVPHTAKMIQEINELLNTESGDWKSYKPIYDHLKKLYGKVELSDGSVEYRDLNIEDLVSNLDELVLLLDGTHNLSPFFKDFTELFKNLYGFRDIKNFRDRIEDKLKEWIMPNIMKLDYYRSLLEFAAENPGAGLRVFTLNYDKCIEMAFDEHKDIKNVYLERGFGINERQGCVWSTKNFDDYNEQLKHLFLYKMHGSIDWARNDKKELTKSNRASVEELIFGTRQKVKAHDPYLYYVYQFRTFTLNANLIIVCGYGFGDEHINGILHQSLQNNPNQKILICRYPESDNEKPEELAALSDEDREVYMREIADQYIIPKKLKLENSNQIILHFGPAGDFFSQMLKMSEVERLFPEDEIEKQFFSTTVADDVEANVEPNVETENLNNPTSIGTEIEEAF